MDGHTEKVKLISVLCHPFQKLLDEGCDEQILQELKQVSPCLLYFIVYRMEFNMTRWSCHWNILTINYAPNSARGVWGPRVCGSEEGADSLTPGFKVPKLQWRIQDFPEGGTNCQSGWANLFFFG